MGSLIRDARFARGISQKELAERVGVEQQSVSKWEQGRAKPRAQILNMVADVLQIPAVDLLLAAGYAVHQDPATGGLAVDDSSTNGEEVRLSAAGADLAELEREDPQYFDTVTALVRQHLDRIRSERRRGR